MKKTFSFRLKPQTAAVLTLLANERDITQTQIVEDAIFQYSKIERPKNKEHLKYAGILGPKQADRFLKTIYANRKNKDIKIYL